MSYIIGIIVLIVMSAYFSATETAFSSLNRMKIKSLTEKNNKTSKRASLVLELTEKYDKLISTILIGNNIVNISVASLGTVYFMQLDEVNGATISTIVITILVLIFGEISPKSIAKDCPEKFALFSAPIINLLIVILTPINFIFTKWKNILSSILKIENESKISSEELILMVDEVQKDGNLDLEDSELIKNAIEFSDNIAEKIITHRVDLEGVDITATKEEIAELFSRTQYSRLLIYDGSIDNIIGILHMKDFYIGTGITKQEIKDIMTKPVFIRQFEKIHDLLKLLQKDKSHVAVVIDEFGGTQGIITMEDILEELVGDIWDEHDDVIEFVTEINDTEYKVDCNMSIIDFYKFFNINDFCEGVLVSGWIIDKLEKIPEINDEFSFENLKIRVSEIDSHRAKFIIVKKES